MQTQLAFDSTPNCSHPQGERLAIHGAEVVLFPHCYSQDQADLLLHTLLHHTPWRQDVLKFGGREVLVPRLQAWYGDANSGYTYSGLRLDPLPWTADLLHIRARVEALAGTSFNSVLLNHYRDGCDSVAWHSDDEKELGVDPVVASLSLGVARRFELRQRGHKPAQRFNYELGHGSLLVMGRGLQGNWQHRVPKQPELSGARINLTFRRIYSA